MHSYASNNNSGSINRMTQMISPLRLQQTRYKAADECSDISSLSAKNYDGGSVDVAVVGDLLSYLSNRFSTSRGGFGWQTRYPSCMAEGEGLGTSKETFGDLPGFQYTLLTEDSPVCNPHIGCIGPGAFVRDVWAAKDYRNVIDELIENRWIDNMTHTVTARMQLSNAQSGCFAFVDVIFHQTRTGKIRPFLNLDSTCSHHTFRRGKPGDLWSGSFLALTKIPTSHIIIYCICMLYGTASLFRLLRVVYRYWVSVYASNNNEEPSWRTIWNINVAFNILQCSSIFYLLISLLNHRHQCDRLLDLLVERRRGLMSQGSTALLSEAAGALQDIIKTAPTELSQRAQASYTHLHACINYGDVWVGGNEFLDVDNVNYAHLQGAVLSFDYDHIPFVDISFLCYFERSITIAKSFVMVVAIFKTFRYLQAWRPLTLRFAALGGSVPHIFAILMFILHLLIAFTFFGNLLFGAKIVDFSTFALTLFSLFSLLVGRANTAKTLVENSLVTSEPLGIVYLFVFVVIMCFTVSSIIIGTFTEVWADTTAEIEKRQSKKVGC